MEINYTLSQQQIYEACMHKLEPQVKKIPVRALIAAICIFVIDMCIFGRSVEGINRMNLIISVLSSIFGFFLIWYLLNLKFKAAAKKYASRISPNSEPVNKVLILGDDFIQFVGNMEIKSEYSKVKSVELTEKYLYIDISGAMAFLPIRQIENEKPTILEILRSKACNAEWKGC
jgi:hypothetical protein